MKLGIITIGGPSAKTIAKRAKEYFDSVELINLKKVSIKSGKNPEVSYEGKKLQKYDCIYMRGSYKYALLQTAISRMLYGKVYLPLHPTSFYTCHNKYLTALALQKKNVPIPDTYLAATTEQAKKILEKVVYPIILKIPEGTQGKGVMFADSLPSAKSMIDTLETFNQPYIIQEYIESRATDIRAIVAGGKVIAAMRRKAANNELRANIHLGGKGEPYELDYDTEQTAIKAAKAVKADICGVDMLEGRKTVVIEVNTSPGLKGITEATKKDLAKIIAKMLYKETKKFIDAKSKEDAGNVLSKLSTNKKKQQILMNLDIKAGIIKLPKILTKIAKFKSDDDAVITAQPGRIEIKKYDKPEDAE